MMRTMGLIGLLIVLTATTGCLTSRFPYMGSFDRHNFSSTATLPLNVTVKDVITGEEVLDIDVPVRHMLVIDLEHKEDNTAGLYNAYPAEKVYWEILPVGTIFPGLLANEMDLSGNPVILKVTVREPTPGEGGMPTYQPTERPTNGSSPTYTPQGPATREVSEPQPKPDEPEMQTDTGTSATPKAEPNTDPNLGASDSPRKTPNYTPTETETDKAPAGADDLEGALD